MPPHPSRLRRVAFSPAGRRASALWWVAALLFSVASAYAVEPDEMLKDPVLEARARAVTRELRCVVCQNQSVDDSDAPLARDIRVLVRERIQMGDSDAAARDFIVARYGAYVLLRPPLQGDTLVLWFGPGLFLVGGLVLAWFYVARLNRAGAAPAALSASEEDAVRRRIDEQAGT
ncbi:MAG: cytochrome c-type biogenesis protein CcmH [Alphaproteobacteria bacterium]|nr:cytochrome c-type biogenesis protein CcmH [Alphaproteobacteria bacterium]